MSQNDEEKDDRAALLPVDASAAVKTEALPNDDAPLFIPLKGEYFDAFADGRKSDELRRYGTRWNEYTCRPGRRVLLSRGYGNTSRLDGVIWKFKKQHGSTFGSTYRAAIQACFGTLDLDIACISIQVGSGNHTAPKDSDATRRSAAK